MERYNEKQSTTRYHFLGLIQLPNVERLCTLSLQTPGAPSLRDETSASASKQLASTPGMLGAQGVSLQCSHTRLHALPSPRTRQRPSRPLSPFSLQTQGFYHPPGPTRLQKAKGMLPFVALPCGLPLLQCTRRAAAGTRRVLQMDCTAVGIWQAAGCLGTC